VADIGYRSIEVLVTNDTRGNLSLQGVGIGSYCTWVQGETPTQGSILPQYNPAKWGVYTNDVNAAASGQVQLTGLGSFPVSITFINNAAGASSCAFAPNDAVQGLVQQPDTGDQNHTLFVVQLIPASGSPWIPA